MVVPNSYGGDNKSTRMKHQIMALIAAHNPLRNQLTRMIIFSRKKWLLSFWAKFLLSYLYFQLCEQNEKFNDNK